MVGKHILRGVVATVVLLAFSIGLASFLQAQRPLYNEYPQEAGPAAVPPCAATAPAAAPPALNPAMPGMVSVADAVARPQLCWADGKRHSGTEFLWLAALAASTVVIGDAICLVLFFRRQERLDRGAATV